MINLSDYTDFFIFLGGLILAVGLVYVFLDRRLQHIPPSTPAKNIDSQALFKKLSVVILIIIIAGFLFNQFLMWEMNSSGILGKLFSVSINITRK